MPKQTPPKGGPTLFTAPEPAKAPSAPVVPAPTVEQLSDEINEQLRQPIAPDRKEVADGRYPGVSWAEYGSWDRLHYSVIKEVSRSVLHARERLIHPPRPTVALYLGQAIHAAVFQPSHFAAEFVKAPHLDLRTKVGKETWAALERAHPKATILREAEFDMCVSIRDAVWQHPRAQQLLAGRGVNELGIAWTDAETGVPCKSRLDRYTALDGFPTIVDLKSTEDARPRAFSRSIEVHRYHEQAAMQIDGVDHLAGDNLHRRYVYLVVEKERPWAVVVYELDADSIEQGRSDYRAHLRALRAAIESGEWPGYPDQDIGLPHWARTLTTSTAVDD